MAFTMLAPRKKEGPRIMRMAANCGGTQKGKKVKTAGQLDWGMELENWEF